MLLFSLLSCADPAPPALPDIILVALDDVRWDHTSSSGYSRDTTPNLVRLSEQPGAVTFSSAYTAAPWSLPAYASLFTGMDPLAHGLGFSTGTLSASHRTLAEILSAYGYATAGFCSGPHLSPKSGLSRGFSVYSHHMNFTGMAPKVSAALAWLDAQEEGPVMMFVHGYDAHPPSISPAAISELFAPAGDHLPADCSGQGFGDQPADRACVSQELPSPDQQAHHIAHYDSAIYTADYQLGRLLRGLEQRGRLDRAVVVVLSDHGESLGEQGRLEGEEGDAFYRVPLVIRRPDDAPPARREAVVSLTGLVPALLTELDIPLPAQTSGPSLWPVLQGEAGAGFARAASLCNYQVWTEQWELRWVRPVLTPDSPDAVARCGPGRWKLLTRAGEEVDAPETIAALQEHLSGWPLGRDLDPERVHGSPDDAMKKILQEGGYWTPGSKP